MSFIPILSTNNEMLWFLHTCEAPKNLGPLTWFLWIIVTIDMKKISKGAFTCNVKSVLSENLGGILGGTQCWMGDCLILSEC